MHNQNSSNEINHKFVVLISLVAAIGGFLFGFDSGVINGTVDGLQQAFNSDSVGTGFNVASMLLGCAAGAFFAGHLADSFGRRALLMASAIFFIISAWGSGAAESAVAFINFRVLGGLAVGAASVMAPAYISEIAPASYRGRLASLQQLAIIGGLFSAFVSNYILSNTAGSSTTEFWFGYLTWRWMFWMELIPATVFFVTLLFIPDSPRFLAASGQKESALKVLTKILGSTAAVERLKEIDALLSEDYHRPIFSGLIDSKTGKVRTVLWVGIGLAVFQQLVGINVVFYYGAILWQAVGFSENDALLINVISGALSIAAVAVTLMLVDKVGRRPLLWIGSAGMAASLIVVALAFSTASTDAQAEVTLSDKMGIVALIAANTYVMFFNGSWGPVMWVMLGEMFPNQIRGSGLAVAGLCQWVANFAITMTFPIMLASIGLSGAYSIYAFFAVASVVFVLKFVQETNGLELEEMQR